MITGRNLIVYILKNHLEDKPLFTEGEFMGYRTIEKYAKDMDVGVETVRAWIQLGNIQNAISIGDTYLIPNYDFMMGDLFYNPIKGAENVDESN